MRRKLFEYARECVTHSVHLFTLSFCTLGRLLVFGQQICVKIPLFKKFAKILNFRFARKVR